MLRYILIGAVVGFAVAVLLLRAPAASTQTLPAPALQAVPSGLKMRDDLKIPEGAQLRQLPADRARMFAHDLDAGAR